MIFLRIYRHFQSLLFLKTKEKGKEILHLDHWTSISFSPWVPGRVGKQRRGGWPESGMEAHRRRGRSGGKAPRRREGPVDGLGRGWGGRLGVSPGSRAPAAAVGGGGGAAGLGGGERVGEHQRMSRKLFAGFVGREEGWRRELHGRPASGGANGGRR